MKKLRVLLKKSLQLILPEFSKLWKSEYNFDFLRSYTDNVELGLNTFINPIHWLNNVQIGDYTYISQNSQVSNAKIGKFCSIGPNFMCGWGIHPTSGLSTSPMFYSTKKQNGCTLSLTDKIEERKRINIGNDVFIGANVTVLDGVTIGHGAVIGAGAVVSKDIPAYAIAVGCPIKVIKYRFRHEQIKALLKIEWWNFSEKKLVDVEKKFFDVDSFIKKYAT